MSSSTESDSKNNNNSEANIEKKMIEKVCYQIRLEMPVMKCSRFYLMKEDETLYMAKLKYDKVYIAEGDNFHIKKKKKVNTTEIKRDCRGYNIITSGDQEFKIKYFKDCGRFPMTVTFPYNGHKICWDHKETNYQDFIKEESKKKPRKSTKNLMLQNSHNLPTFILRKMKKNLYEVECFPTVDPVIVFSIALSGIIGPIAL